MKGIIFCKRTIKEILRDPLSYIFCLGFPIVMLIIMSIVNNSIPKEAGMKIFELDYLAPGMAYFGLSFVMLFTCIQVSKDRTTSLLMRLHASPMKSIDFIIGYTLPVIIIALLQMLITYTAALILAAIIGKSISIAGILLSIITLLPSALCFISFGLIFGTLVSEKAAPGICSIIITVNGMIGNIWMDVDQLGGSIQKLSKALPFYHGVKCARLSVAGNYSELAKPVIISIAWALGLYILATFIMNSKLKKDVQ